MVSKLFRAYGLYNRLEDQLPITLIDIGFQSSFELMGYITRKDMKFEAAILEKFQSSFELMGYITNTTILVEDGLFRVSKLFRAYGLYNRRWQILM